ncbi:hypothetical protein CEE37_02375 [candidate division LCP-89 bacterium B3_LCP]|uniref:Glycosyltransferase RgtA/B/C/D-like domain-containing protein n=1 Tax=candidate division LCP-89 bacterium B3_LCP TaxID=2012998 RepID=A0A532V5S6_UNCL8|nr:MAG: hypothetical protein CEE37_02375 [candidate division LCP-89 bacterium B3_LCP]
MSMENTQHPSVKTSPVTVKLLGFIALVHVLLHVLTNGNYGMFRDEFYYLACADHLAWGYVDHPPLSIALLAGWKALFGDSVQAVRLLAALAGGSVIFMTGILARELGGGRYAQVLAAVCLLISPLYLDLTGPYSMNAFDSLFWIVAFYLIARIINHNEERLWIILGVIIGLGLLNKISVLFLVFGLAVGLILTKHRSAFRTKYLWFGAAIAAAIFTPHIIWQIDKGWPTLEFMNNARLYKMLDISPSQFISAQIVGNHPFSFPIWLIGLLFLLFHRKLKVYRIFGIIFIAVFALLVIQQGKSYYLEPAFPVVFAAGGFAIESWLDRKYWRWAIPVMVAVLLFGGAVTAPMSIPLLPVEEFIAYQEKTGQSPSSSERHQMGLLPQHFADRFGWQELAAAVTSTYQNLESEQKSDCIIVASNYGEAGAITYYGRGHDLPQVYSGHNNYYYWGPGDTTAQTVISVGFNPEDLASIFTIVSPSAQVKSQYAMPYEADLIVYLCTDPQVSLSEIWEDIKHFE